MNSRSTLIALSVVLLSGIGIATAGEEGGSSISNRGKQQTAVIHLSHFTDDLHRAFMAVKIANLMQGGGVETTLFLDIEGARVSDSRQSLDVLWGPSPSTLGELLDNFIKSGGKVVVCPHCAKAAGIKPDHVRQGAKIGSEKDLATMLISADKIMDY